MVVSVLVSTCPPCHYPGGDEGQQRETRDEEEKGGRREREKTGQIIKKTRDRKSGDLGVTVESEKNKTKRDTERLQGGLDVTETGRQDKNGPTEMWMDRKRQKEVTCLKS